MSYSRQSNKLPNIEINDVCIIYKFRLSQNLCGGTILTAKREQQKVLSFHRESNFVYSGHDLFYMREMKRKKIQLEIFQSVIVSSQIQSSYS